MDEFAPLETLKHLLQFWWIALITTLVGGGIAVLITQIQPPIYQATAGFVITIDREQAGDAILNEYDVDLAYATIHTGLATNSVLDDVIAAAKQAGIAIDYQSFETGASVDRILARWQIHYRSSDPVIAQTVVNLWAERAFAEINLLQAQGHIADYISYLPPELADLPTEPLRFSGTHRTLAGAIIGLVIGLFLIEINAQRRQLNSQKKTA